MRVFRALRHRQVQWLWGGQVFSAMGDEIYGIALVWYATNLLGTDAGYLSAVQAGSVFIFSLFGGVLVDHLDNRRVMILSDVLRGLAVLSLPILGTFGPLSLWAVVVVAILVSSLSAFFNPALAGFIPQMTKDRALLQATNGLMETTSRFARIIGPGLVGLLGRHVPLIHFFTVDAISFFVSALSVSRAKPDPALVHNENYQREVFGSLMAGYRLAKTNPVLRYTVYSTSVAASAWLFVVPLGMTLLVRERLPSNIGALGFLISAYGIGNVVSNIVIANFHFHRPQRWIFSGRLVAGVGIFLLSFSTTLEQMMLASALTAVGGPLADLGYVNFIQKVCSGREIARIFRYITAVGQGSLLIVYLVSPKLFDQFSVSAGIASAAVLVFLSGLIGFVVDREV